MRCHVEYNSVRLSSGRSHFYHQLLFSDFRTTTKGCRKCVYIDKGVGGRHKTTLTHYVLHFTDNYQETDISGRLEKYNFHDGDTVSVTYQHGWIGWDVVSDIKSHCNRSKTTMHREN